MNRLSELDQSKGLALIFSIFFILSKLTLSAFKDWNPGNLSFNGIADWLFLFESFTQMSIIYFGAYLCNHFKLDIKFLIRHFIKLVLISSFIFIHGLEFIKIHWTIIQSLFFYYLVFYTFQNFKYPKTLGVILVIFSITSLLLEKNLQNSFFGFLLFGDFSSTNSFNINQGMVCSILSFFIIKYNLNIKQILAASSLILLCSLIHFHFTETNLKIPLLATTVSGIIFGTLSVNFFNKNSYSLLSVLGKNSFYLYLLSWLFIHWLIIWNNIFWNTEKSLFVSISLTVLFVLSMFYISKKGIIWKKTKSF